MNSKPFSAKEGRLIRHQTFNYFKEHVLDCFVVHAGFLPFLNIANHLGRTTIPNYSSYSIARVTIYRYFDNTSFEIHIESVYQAKNLIEVSCDTYAI